MFAASRRPVWRALGLLVMHDNIWIYVGATDNVCRDVLHTTSHLMVNHLLAARSWWRLLLNPTLSRYLVRRELLLLSIVEGFWLWLDRSCRIVLGLTQVLLVVVPIHFWMLNCSRHVTVFKRLLARLLQREVRAVCWHLLRLVMRICRQALDQLIVLLDFLLIVLHGLEL